MSIQHYTRGRGRRGGSRERSLGVSAPLLKYAPRSGAESPRPPWFFNLRNDNRGFISMQLFLVGFVYLFYVYTTLHPRPVSSTSLQAGQRPWFSQSVELHLNGVRVLRQSFPDQSSCIQIPDSAERVCLPPPKKMRGAPVLIQSWPLAGAKGVGFLYADQVECAYIKSQLRCKYRAGLKE